MRLLPATAAVLLLLLPAPGRAERDREGATLFQWTDETGTVRYATDRDWIPRSRRDTIVPLGSAPGAEATDPAPDATSGGTIPSVIGAPVPASEPRSTPSQPRSLPLVPDGSRAAVPGSEFSESARGDAAAALPETPPVSSRGAPEDEAAPAAPSLAERIAQLERQIADDEETLKQLISEEGPENAAHAARVREIAARLPDLQADLRALRQQQATQGGL